MGTKSNKNSRSSTRYTYQKVLNERTQSFDVFRYKMLGDKLIKRSRVHKDKEADEADNIVYKLERGIKL